MISNYEVWTHLVTTMTRYRPTLMIVLTSKTQLSCQGRWVHNEMLNRATTWLILTKIMIETPPIDDHYLMKLRFHHLELYKDSGMKFLKNLTRTHQSMRLLQDGLRRQKKREPNCLRRWLHQLRTRWKRSNYQVKLNKNKLKTQQGRNHYRFHIFPFWMNDWEVEYYGDTDYIK